MKNRVAALAFFGKLANFVATFRPVSRLRRRADKSEAMQQFEMVAKTFMGLEDVLAEELRGIGAINVEPGNRMVSFEGTLETLYRANMCCRTALRILKPFYKFIAHDPDELYDRVKEYDWSTVLSPEKTFSIDPTVNGDEFRHSRFVVYRVKDAIVDWFRDAYDDGRRPSVRLQDADVMINVHIAGSRVTLSLDSSGESLHKRGYRVAQTDAPINEVLAAGIILKSGWRGDSPFIDPMCGSGTFLVEAALIGANIMPGVYRRHFAFEAWPDFDRELFDSIYNDDSGERELMYPIIGADVLPKAVAIARENVKSAGVGRYVSLEVKNLDQWTEAPEGGVLVTNPPYGERINVDDMAGLYHMIGSQLKHVFKGYHAWIIGYRDEYFHEIGLTPSVKLKLLNGSLECELREYVIFDGDYRSFRAGGGSIKNDRKKESRAPRHRDYGDAPGRKGLAPAKGPRKFRDDKPKFRDDKPKFRDNKPKFRDDKPKFRDEKPKFKGKKFDARDSSDSPRSKSAGSPASDNRSYDRMKFVVGKQPSLPPANIKPRGWRKPKD